MVKYSCEKCGKEFTQKGHYTKHTTKKKPCIFESKIEEMIEKIVAKKIDEITFNASTNIINQPSSCADDSIITHKEVKYIDLFCGLGAFHYAFNSLQTEDTKYKCVFACDIDDNVRKIYKENYGITPEGDINNINIENIPDFDILCGGFPCFIAGTQTLTNNGYKNIEDVELTDKLLTHTGKFQNILNLQRKQYSGELFDIKIKFHPEIISSTEEHPFYVCEKKKKWDSLNRRYNIFFTEPKWKKANELTMKDYFGMVINDNEIIPEFTFEKTINQHKKEQINIKLDNLDYWFVMGYFIGDGWIEETTKEDEQCMYKIRFAINNKDEEEVFERINKVIPIVDKKCDTGGKCKKFGCSNIIWYNILKEFGKFAHGKLIPEWVQDAPKEFIQEFINGYMKADGCINNNNISQITTVSSNLAYGLQRLYLKLGHIFSINKCVRPKTTVIEGRTVNQRDTYCIRRVLQKKNIGSSFIKNNYVWFSPFKITKRNTNETTVYNFEVENDNSYIIKNTIVHNCQPFSIAGKKEGFEDKIKGNLFYSILKIIDIKMPNTIVLENVKNLLTINGGETFNIINAELQNRGYIVSFKIIDSKYYNSPQSRQRIFIIGSKIKKYEFPLEPSKIITPVSSIIDYNETKYLNYEDKYKLEKCKDTGSKNNCKMLYKLIHKISNNGGRQGERVYSIDSCGPTICASSGGPGAKTGLYYIDGKVRRLNVNEGLKMFGFDEDYKWNTIVKNEEILFYLGNCIVVNVVKVLLSNLL
jgi:DNA-cytosine methyltransferase